jgi:predicted amidohydrolase YtcJ
LRVNGALDVDPSKDLKIQFTRLKELRGKYNSKLIKASTAKFFADGVVEGMTAFLLEPYESKENHDEPFFGEPLWTVDDMKEAFKLAVEENFLIHVHCIGDGAAKYTIDAFEEAYKDLPGEKFRNSITHLQLINEEDIDKMARLSIAACTQPYWHFKEPGIFENIEKPLLGERAEKMYPLKTFLDKGILVTASSDHPVTAEPNPFYAVQAAVTRNLYNAENYGIEPIKNKDNPSYLLNKEERVSVIDIMKAFTINGAYALKREHEVGSIEVGKYADLVVLSDNPLEVDVLELEKIKVLETIFEGKTIYRLKNETKLS